MIKEFLSLFVPLLIIMDPAGNLPLFLAMTADLDRTRQVRVAAVACFTAALILFFFGLTGDAALRLFGITVPAFQLAGGFIFFIYALQMFNLIPPPNLKSSAAEEAESLRKNNIALVPLAIPLLAGPGAITAVLVWQQDPTRQISPWLLGSVIAAACACVFLAFYAARWIRRVLGVGGIGVVTRLSGLLLAVIAMQFVIDGLCRVLR
ncbi:MarC family protein [Methylohalobius crimeensis]|uniref:MarC family protein n=1 Tax=Methylohalobius crimeensis TaxID=244365 RepID=UPI0003B74ED5|nr:MarC family protein [Methylohalobius crimeensis]